MGIQYSTALRNNQLDQIEATAGANPRLRLYTGTVPANCAAAASGTLLVEMVLPADWMATASGAIKSKLGTWSGSGLDAAGFGTNAGYFRITDSAGTTTHMQGTVTITGGGGDMQLDNINIAQNQLVMVNTFVVTGGNA